MGVNNENFQARPLKSSLYATAGKLSQDKAVVNFAAYRAFPFSILYFFYARQQNNPWLFNALTMGIKDYGMELVKYVEERQITGDYR